MKIVNQIPEARTGGEYTITMKRKREVNEFIKCGAKYAEFVRYSKDIGCDATCYRGVVKTLGVPVRIIARGKSVYAERLEEPQKEEPKAITEKDSITEQIKELEAQLIAARNRVGGENESC